MGEDGGPGEGGRSGWVWDDPELALRVEDDGDGFEACGSDGPAAGEDFDGVIVCAAALEVDGQVQVAERRGASLERFSSRASCQAWSGTRPVVRQGRWALC